MNVFDKKFKDLPEYGKFMFLDGYTPEEILEALKRQTEAEAIERDEEAQLSKIKSEVKFK